MNEIKVAGKQKFMELDIYSVEEFESLPREGMLIRGVFMQPHLENR